MSSGRWAGSPRRSELPRNWPEIRLAQLKLDSFRCKAELPDGRRCPEMATDVDHIDNQERHSHRVGVDLQSLCGPHHRRKSAMEGVAARARKAAQARRPPEIHPGTRR